MARLIMRTDPVTRAWALVTSAGVARLGLGFVASLVIARALGPADFGVYAVLAASVGIIGSLAEGGFTEAAVLRIAAIWPAQPAEAERRARIFFWLRLGLSIAVVAVGCLAAALISRTFLNGLDEGLLRWALVGIVATAASGATSAMLQATGAFGRMSSLTLINTGLTAALAISLAIFDRLDLLSALIILGIGTSVATFASGLAVLPSGWRLGLPPLREVFAEGRQLVHIGRWLWLASLFAMLAANAEVLMLNHWAALSLVGAYALALSLATKADVVNHSLYTVLLPGLAALDRREQRRAYMRRGLVRSGAIAVGLLLLMPLAEPLVLLFYGVDFEPAAPLLRLLLGVMMVDVLLTPFILLPLAYRQPKLLAAADAARAVTLIALGVGFIPTYGAFGAIGARLGSRLVGAALVLVALTSGRQTLQIQDEEPAGVFD